MQIYLSIQDDRQGPFTPEEIAAKLQSGECTPETLAWKEGLEAWQPLRDVLPQSEAAQPPPLPVAPPSLSETSASKPVMVINERTSQRSRMKPRRPNGLAGGCFMFCVGSVMCFVAFLLCLTGIGAILGVPIFIAGMGIAYVAAPAIAIALGISNKANIVARGPRPSTEPDPEDDPSALPQPSAPPSLPETPAAKVSGGSNAFFDFFRAYRGMFPRIKSSPLPQAAQWFDRYSVIFPAAFLAFFFFGLGLIPLLLTSRLSGGDKGRLAVIAAWPLYLAMLPAIGPLLVLLVLLLPVIALVMMWVKKWFSPAVRYTVTGIVGFGVVCLIGLIAVTIMAGTKDVLHAAARDAGSNEQPKDSTSSPPGEALHRFREAEHPTWSSQAIMDELNRLQEQDAKEMQQVKERLAKQARGGRLKITEADLGFHWPFKMSQGTLRNEPFGSANLITFEAPDGTVVALNGTARGEIGRHGWLEVEALTDENKGSYESIRYLIELGLMIRPR